MYYACSFLLPWRQDPGLVLTGWGLMVAFFSVSGAPWLQRRLGIARTLYGNLALFAVVVLVIAVWTAPVDGGQPATTG